MYDYVGMQKKEKKVNIYLFKTNHIRGSKAIEQAKTKVIIIHCMNQSHTINQFSNKLVKLKQASLKNMYSQSR